MQDVTRGNVLHQGDLLLVSGKSHFLLFTLYDKVQKDALTKAQYDILREMLEQARRRGVDERA